MKLVTVFILICMYYVNMYVLRVVMDVLLIYMYVLRVIMDVLLIYMQYYVSSCAYMYV